MRKKVEIGSIAKVLRNYVKEHASEILTGAGCVGVILTGIAAYKAYPKVEEALKDSKNMTKTEKIIAVAPHIAQPVVTGAVTIGCIVSSNVISTKKLLAATACYKAIDEAYKAYKDADKEVAGESHVGYVQSLANEELNDISRLVHMGQTIMMEKETGRVFYASPQALQKAATMAITDFWPPFPEEMPIEIDVNAVYSWLGLAKTEFGKRCFKLYEPHIEIEFEPALLPNGEEYIIFSFPQLSQSL